MFLYSCPHFFYIEAVPGQIWSVSIETDSWFYKESDGFMELLNSANVNVCEYFVGLQWQ